MQSVGITKFILERQCDPDFKGTRLTPARLTELAIIARSKMNMGEYEEGYATFCKNVIIDNVYKLTCPIAEITDENIHLLRSSYVARTPTELPVLTRYFPIESGIPRSVAKKLYIILYSKEQSIKEKDSSGSDWDIVCVNAELDTPAPMNPNTILRNALGIEFGGSGVPVDRKKYNESVEFWSKHAMVE